MRGRGDSVHINAEPVPDGHRDWTVVEWYREPGQRVWPGAPLVRLAAGSVEATVRSHYRGRLEVITIAVGDSATDRASLGKIARTSPARRRVMAMLAVATLVLVALVGGALLALVGDGDTTNVGSDVPLGHGGTTATPQATVDDQAERRQRCDGKRRTKRPMIAIDQPGEGIAQERAAWSSRIRPRVPARLEIVACPIGRGGKPEVRPFGRGERVVVVWTAHPVAESRPGALCVSTHVAGARFVRAMRLTGDWSFDTIRGAGSRHYRIRNGSPRKGWVEGRFEVRTASGDGPPPRISVGAIRCSDRRGLGTRPRTFPLTLTAESA